MTIGKGLNRSLLPTPDMAGAAGADAARGEAQADDQRERRDRVPAASPAMQQPGQQRPAGGDEIADALHHAGELGGGMGIGGAQRYQGEGDGDGGALADSEREAP